MNRKSPFSLTFADVHPGANNYIFDVTDLLTDMKNNFPPKSYTVSYEQYGNRLCLTVHVYNEIDFTALKLKYSGPNVHSSF